MANRLVGPGITYLDDNGSPLSGGLLYFYESGSSSTAKATYSDSSLTSANANPVVLDSAGRVNGEVFGDGAYRLIIKDSGGVEINTFDPVGGDSVSSTASVFAADTGSADTYIISPNPAFSSLSEGNRFAFFAGNANTGASTLAVNENAAKAIQIQGAALAGGEIGAGDLVEVAYTSGGVFEIVNNPTWNTFPSLTTGNVTFNTANPKLIGNDADGVLSISADVDTDTGFNTIHYAGTHATKASDFEWRVGTTVVFQYDHSTSTMDFKSKNIKTSTTVLVGSGASDQGDGCVDITGSYSISGTAIQIIKAWVSFDPSGTLTVLDSFNVTSVTDNGTGEYTVNWNTNFANNDYAAVAICQRDTASAVSTLNSGIGGSTSYTQAVGSCKFVFETLSAAAQDPKQVNVIALGDQ